VHGGYRASLALRDGDRGLVIHCHAGCAQSDILVELRRLGLLHGNALDTDPIDPAEVSRRRETEVRKRQRRIALARDIASAALPTLGTPVERYLRARIPGLAELPPTIGYLPMGDAYSRHNSGTCRPVMVAPVEHVEHGIMAAHRTWLAIDGSVKASLDPVRIMTGPVKGGAVRLASAGETLMVGEGVETCLAAMTATGMPAWAALSTSGLTALVLPPVVLNVLILADHDLGGAGQRAAYAAAQRWIAQGRRIRIVTPPVPGTDMADVLASCGSTRMTEENDVAA
jgi:hypothetical protein